MALEFTQYFSSSRGNLYEVSLGEDRLMIECGVPWKHITDRFDLLRGRIHGCLVTHHHKDHCKSMETVDEVGIPVYGPGGEFPEENYVQPIYTCNTIGPFTVIPFHTKHTEFSMGYVIGHSNEWLFFAVDAKTIPARFNIDFDIIAIECNHDKEIVQALVDKEEIHPAYADNIRQHLDIETTKRYLREFCSLRRCKELHLLHISKTFPDIEQVRAGFAEEFMLDTKIVGDSND